ncbi:MAG: DUF4349 domain-containing protein [Clostridia bacterium]|nr:DUF4349 domain-containing protein [Clostridia bacterium]
MVRKVLAPVVLVLVLAAFLAGCGRSQKAVPPVAPAPAEDAVAEKAPGTQTVEALASGARAEAEAGPGLERVYASLEAVQERKVVRNAELVLEVASVDEAVKELEREAAQLGGLVAQAELDRYDARTRAHLELHVPADKLETFLAWAAGLGEVKSQRVYSDDVTEEYIDLEARVKTLTAQEERLTELLAKAETVEDILKVEKELERVRAERESLAGKFNYLRHRVTYSRVSIQVKQSQEAEPVPPAQGFKGLGARTAKAFLSGWNALQNLIAGIVLVFASLLTWIPLLAVIAFLGWRLWLRRGRKGKA